MYPNDLVSNKLFTLMNGKDVTAQFVANAKKKFGFDLDQNKTLADFNLPGSSVAVGQTVITPINGVSFPQGEHMIISALRILQGANAVLGSTVWTAGVNDGLVQAGTLTILQNGTNVIKNMPLTAFTQSTNENDSGFLFLANPIYWVAQTQLVAQITFPSAPVTANLNLRIEVIGSKLI